MNLTDSLGNFVEYHRNEQAGHEQDFGPIYLPQELNNQPYVQLRWKYYFTGQQLDPGSGQRDELRLDNVFVSSDVLGIGENPARKRNQIMLEPVFPNPFRESATIRYQLPEAGFVHLAVFNHTGKIVAVIANDKQPSGQYEIIFDGSNLPPGLYFLQILQNENQSVRKMMIVR